MVNFGATVSAYLPIIIFLIFLIVGAFILWRSVNSASVTVGEVMLIDPERVADDAEFLDYLQHNRKINAIKRYRELTGVGLKEAKDAVEYIQRNPDALVQKRANRLSAESAETPFDAGIRELIRQDKSHEAIKVYQDFTGASLSEAAVEIERISWEMEERDKRSSEDSV